MKCRSSNEGFTLLVMPGLEIVLTLFFKPLCTSIGMKDRLQNMKLDRFTNSFIFEPAMKYNRTLEVGQTERAPAFKDFKIYLTKGRFFVGWGRQNSNDMQ